MFFNKSKNELNNKINELNYNLEKSNIMEIAYILGNKKELMKINLITGIFRGIGIGIGVTIVTAIIVFILQKIVTLNIPIIGGFIAEIVETVKSKTTY